MSSFAQSVLLKRYCQPGETSMRDVARRVTRAVFSAVPAPADLARECEELIATRTFMPGGRYLYAAGRPFHNVNNCFLLRAEDSREGWCRLLHDATACLMVGGGIGVEYSDVRASGSPLLRVGGFASGPLPLMRAVNEVGRGVRMGGSRRAAIWAGLRWDHPDVLAFVRMKDWSLGMRTLKRDDPDLPMEMEYTNISVGLDARFFEAYSDGLHPDYEWARQVFDTVVRRMLKTGEPGFSVNIDDSRESLRNACVAGSTEILTSSGYRRIDSLVGLNVSVWNGFEWSDVEPRVTGHDRQMLRVELSDGRSLRCTDTHEFWTQVGYPGKGGRQEKVPAHNLKVGDKLIKHDFPVVREGIPGQRAYTQGFVSGDGMDGWRCVDVYAGKHACIPRLAAEGARACAYQPELDKTRLSWSEPLRPKTFVPHDWDLQGRLNWFAGLLDSDGTVLVEGDVQVGSVDRAFLLAVQKMLSTVGVNSKVTEMNKARRTLLPDGRGGQKEYDCQPCWRLLLTSAAVQTLLARGLECSRLDLGHQPNRDAARFVTVVSVEPAGIEPVVYCFTEHKRNLGCFDGVVTGQCCELTSADDSDVCNLGSINLARVASPTEMTRIVEVATAFLLAGTVYSDVPYPKVAEVRAKNRRLGLGLMGLHEWLLARGKRYAPTPDLHPVLDAYRRSGEFSKRWAAEWGLSEPVKTRAVAPTGTIGTVAETTTGIEPVFCSAYRRRWYVGEERREEVVVDPTARRAVEEWGLHPDDVEDSYAISFADRVGFQGWLQRWVDHAISSTVNLPKWGTSGNNPNTVEAISKTLLGNLPMLRGLTCYPDGSRGEQPLERCSWAEASGARAVEAVDVCALGGGDSCGA